MTKVLNLDDVAAPPKQFVYQGETHEVKQLSVAGYMEVTKIIEKVQEQAEAETDDNVMSELEQFGMMKRVIQLTVPTMTDELINSMTLPQLMALSEFVKEVEEEGMEDAVEEGK